MVVHVAVPHNGNLMNAEKEITYIILAHKGAAMWKLDSIIKVTKVVYVHRLIASLDPYLKKLSLDLWLKARDTVLWMGTANVSSHS